MAPGDGRAGTGHHPLCLRVGTVRAGRKRPGPRHQVRAEPRGEQRRGGRHRQGGPGGRRQRLVAAAGDVRHRVVARPAGHHVGRHRAAGRRVLPDDGGREHAGQRALPRAAAADAVRQGVHRRRVRHRQHERRVSRRPGLHRGHRRRARHRGLGRHLRPVRPRAVDRRRHAGALGGAPAPVQRRGRPLRRVLHGHQPVPDGRRGRCEFTDQGDVPDHFGQRPVRRHGDPGRPPRHRVRRHVHRTAVRPEPLQPRAAAAGGGGRERRRLGAGQRAGQPGADRGRAQPGPRVVPQARPRRGDRAGRRRVRPELLGGPQPGPGPGRRRQGRRSPPSWSAAGTTSSNRASRSTTSACRTSSTAGRSTRP